MSTAKDPNELTFDELVQFEKAKRERNWDPQQRWKVLQEMIAWAESQATVRRNTREACLREQARKLAELEGET
jgi:hypothetical protein